MNPVGRTYSPEQSTYIVTAGGWARSGKGTSMDHLRTKLERVGRRVEHIDQGIKFRTMGEVAVTAGQDLDDLVALEDFLRSSKAKEATLEALAEVASMNEKDRKSRLYIPEISRAAGKVGKVPSAHEIAVGLLREQVEGAVESKADIVLIDGRSIEKYAKQFTDEGLAKFAVGWYFKCDPAIAARRSLGLFQGLEDLAADDAHSLLRETLSISDRNRSDILRDIDPLREPVAAYHLDLPTYALPGLETPYKKGFDILQHGGLAVVDTSYTNTIDEMTEPVTELSMLALFHRGALSHENVGIQTVSNF